MGNRKNVFLALTYAVLFVLVLTMLYGFEAYLAYEEYDIELGTTERIRQAADKVHADWDVREKAEVIRDLRAKGVDAQPTLAAQLFVESDGVEVAGKKLFPFGGIGNTTQVFCNEMGFWSMYEADEYGFNNPRGVYKPGQVDIGFVGDSFVNGACLKQGDDLAAQVRRLNLRTINLGIGGTGPLIYQAIIREYLKPVKPKYVFWFHYAVDIRDHVYEQKSPTLMRYLEDPEYSQNLMYDKDTVNDFLRKYFEIEYPKRLEEATMARQNRRKIIFDRIVSQTIRLHKLRERIAQLGGRPVVTEGREQEKLDLLKRILLRTKADVEAWGGKFVFIFLPDWYAYAAPYDTYGIKVDKNFLLREDVLAMVRSLEIPIIDMQADVFDKEPDPVSLYNFRMYGHYTLEGYTKVAKRLEEFIREKTDLLK